MDIVARITQIVSPSLEAMGYHIVQIKMSDAARRKTLSIMAERRDEVPMSFDDCVEISRTAGALLEVEDPIVSAYDLEVLSPGLDRPLTRLEDFTRFAGCEAKLETLIPIDGRKRFRGIIGPVKGGNIALQLLDAPEAAIIEFGNIKAAKLVPEMPGAGAGEKKKTGKEKRK